MWVTRSTMYNCVHGIKMELHCQLCRPLLGLGHLSMPCRKHVIYSTYMTKNVLSFSIQCFFFGCWWKGSVEGVVILGWKSSCPWWGCAHHYHLVLCFSDLLSSTTPGQFAMLKSQSQHQPCHHVLKTAVSSIFNPGQSTMLDLLNKRDADTLT